MPSPRVGAAYMLRERSWSARSWLLAAGSERWAFWGILIMRGCDLIEIRLTLPLINLVMRERANNWVASDHSRAALSKLRNSL